MTDTLITHALIVNEGRSFLGDVHIHDGRIQGIFPQGEPHPQLPPDTQTIDATGCILMPGVIDDHVHFRDPGLTHKADMYTESLAAAAGGVTSCLDMPNVVPQTTTLSLWEQRMTRAAEACVVNYGFYLGATSDNLDQILHMDTHRCPGVKLFMGSSTGNMLVDREEQLRAIFAQCPTLLMTHCEDTDRINRNMAQAEAQYGPDPDVSHHPQIRDAEACYRSTALAVRLAQEYGTRLHVAHVTTERELALFSPTPLDHEKRITAEACVAHLLYCDQDYARLGTRIKCNPAIKSAQDRQALRQALCDGRIDVVGTDHAPHLLSEKEGGCRRAVSGMPMVQFSLVSMLSLVDEGVLSLERVVELMCHAPARLLRIQGRGYIRPGYHADLVLLRPRSPWTITSDCILSRCGWSPREGDTLQWQVQTTWVGGYPVYDHGHLDTAHRGQALTYGE